ncbi:MAG: N-6 adenine-specific DNA methyltransferase 2 [Lasallia pustulata]|uniref:Protein-lysine N-methyltransferase EFM5 n=1 Tax=Lasallia pustulata TaxID=136370 RepID=A0A5M8PHJ0_9LECA|nr:MAG: N-6 adenine-specific DNA methyltransferase 2 [Lasallia pustulata]
MSNSTRDGEEGEERVELSGSALAALQEFYTERDDRQKRFEELKSAAEDRHSMAELSMDVFTEDWNASQFWYSDETATILAKQLLEGATPETRIAVISAPSVFIQVKNLLASDISSDAPQIFLFEIDERFEVFSEFIHYDFRSPLKLPLELKGTFDRIICDPPFLSSDCQTKAAMTARWLSKASPTQGSQPGVRIIVCTGERMESLVLKVYPGVRTTSFEPQHAHGRLSNEFRSYANFECDFWSWR